MAETYTSLIDLKAITFVSSPQHVSIQHLPAVGELRATSMQLKLFIWSGAKASLPSTPSRILNQAATLVVGGGTDETYCFFKIDDFIASELIPVPALLNYGVKNAVWYRVQVIADTALDPLEDNYLTTTNLATLGWGSHIGGANPGVTDASTLSGKIFNLVDRMNITSNVTSRLSMYVGESSNNQKIGLSSLANGVGTSDLVGMKFKGVNQYMDLGIVPLLNSADSKIILKFKATNYGAGSPNYAWGYDNNFASGDILQIAKYATSEQLYLQYNSNTVISPSQYPTPNNYQEIEIYELDSTPSLSVKIGGSDIGGMDDLNYTRRAQSGISFFLGARNLGGTASGFTETIFTEADFYNGTTRLIFNDANNWGGATNHGGTKVYSSDGGANWSDYPSEMINLTVGSTNSSNQFFVANYSQLQPTTGVNNGWSLIYNSGNRKNYAYSLFDIKSQGHEIIFFGNTGVQMSMLLFGRSKTSTTFNRETYNNININRTTVYNPLEHGIKTIRTQSHGSFSLNTGILNYLQLDILKQMLDSEMVWINEANVFIPIVVETKQINWKDEKYVEMHNYEIKFKYANPNINKIG